MPSQRATRGSRHRNARVPAVLVWIGVAVACGADDGPPISGSTGSVDTSTGGPTAASTTALDSSGSDPSTGEPGRDWELSLEVGDEVGAFFSVWGPQPDQLYAVASQPTGGGLSLGSIRRWDGNAWSAHPVPEQIPGLNWVFGVDDRRFLVGELGAILVRDGDEGEWTQYGCETVLPLWGVWAAAVDDAWAVGGDGFNRDPVACHFDGESWTPWPLPEPSFESHALYKIWGTAIDDVWAVGDAGLLMHWGGEAEGWTEVPSGTDFDLISLWGTGPDEILAVGGRATGVLARWDGRQWTAQEVPELPGLNGVWMAPDGTAVVVGPRGGAGVVAPGALVVQPRDSGTGLALHGVYGFGSGERWAVGGSLDMAPPYVGVIVHQIP